ncbi:hypothetical protein WG902_05205 [Ramlibacter sp. PS3R-8]|uniref:hypothetical protein n=1 Tax=Ramlibacter sp. PS3R-8 TaxID=3133437 RepID=UPI0030A3635A
MKNLCASTLLLALAAMPLSALADNCKIKIKDKNGHYREDIKCKGHPHGDVRVHAVVPGPVVVQRPAVVVRQPAVVVRPAVVATPAVVVRQPAVVVRQPAVVVRPPAVVVTPPAPPRVTVRVN